MLRQHGSIHSSETIAPMTGPVDIQIREQSIDLDQFMKLSGVASSGGEAKYFINERMVTVNGESESRRRRTLVLGDIVSITDMGDFRVTGSTFDS